VSDLSHDETTAETAEARWAVDPERIDPDDYAPLRPFAKVMTWAYCARCASQVHALASRFLLAGITCPACGDRLLDPPADGSEDLRVLLRQEDELSEQIE
jgi:hypothetical protein